MKTEVLRDMNFRTIGIIQTDDRGNKVIRDSSFNTKGFYNAQRNITQDSSFKNVAIGDQSITLVKGP
jgi:hypothetical protein